MKKRLILVLLIFSTALFIPFIASLDWVQSGHDLNNTNYQNETINLKGGFVNVWSYTNSSESFDSSPSVSGGILYIGSNDSLLALNTSVMGASGVIWKHKNPYPILSTPEISNGMVYYGDNGGTIYALNATNGSVMWNSSGYQGFQQNSPVFYNDVLYISGKNSVGNGVLYALNATNGSVMWNATNSAANSYYSLIGSPAAANNKIYAADNNGTVHSFNASNGNETWNKTFSYGMDSPPCYSNGAVYVGDYSGAVHAFNATSGKELWNSSAGSPYETDGCAVNNGTVYVQDVIGDILAINTSNGSVMWNFSSGLPVSYYAQAPSVSNNYIFSVNSGGQIYAININKRTEEANYPSAYLGSTSSSPVISGDVIYIGTDNGVIGLASVYPNVMFQNPTPENNSFVNINSFVVNVSATIPPTVGTINNVTINIYNSSGLMESNSTSKSYLYWNITNLSDGKYMINATANNTADTLGYNIINFTVNIVTHSVNSGSSSGVETCDPCITKWECTSWSLCNGGIQNRTCGYILGNCCSISPKPAETQTCRVLQNENNSSNQTNNQNNIPSRNSNTKSTGKPAVKWITNNFGYRRSFAGEIFLLLKDYFVNEVKMLFNF